MARARGKKHIKALGSVQTPKLPIESDKNKDFSGEWVPFFKDDNNTYPNDCAKRAKRSSTHNALIESKVGFITGNGFSLYRNGEAVDMESEQNFKNHIENVNAHGEQLIDIYVKCARDLVTTGNFAIEVVKSKGVNYIYHKDVTTVRLEKADNDGKVNNTYLSPDWPSIKKNTTAGSEEKIIKVPTYTYNDNERNSILFVKEYSPENFYYGTADHSGANLWIDIEYQIPLYNTNRIKNGFNIGALVDVYGEPPNGMTPQEYVNELVEKFTGEGNNSKVLFQMLDSQDQKSSVQILDNVREGDFEKLYKLSVQNIITAHRYTPSLAGVAISGQLGSNQQIQNEFQIVNATVIRPYKDKLLRAFNMILREMGFGVTLDVHTDNPVSVASLIDPTEVLTINEQRMLLGQQPIEMGDVLINKQNI